MRFWFRSPEVDDDNVLSERLGTAQTASIWLHVKRCRLAYTMSAEDETWMACPYEPVTAESMVMLRYHGRI